MVRRKRTNVKGNTIEFHSANGTLHSLRISDVDMAATKKLNKAVSEGRWLDPDTAAWANARVTTFTPAQAKALNLLAKAYDAKDAPPVAVACGDAADLCMLDREAALRAAAYKVLAEEEAAKKH